MNAASVATDGRSPKSWFDEAKLGVFVHWGLYSVPAWAPLGPDLQTLLHDEGPREMLRRMPYAEWYMNTMAIPGSPTRAHHVATRGADFAYDDFRPAFDEGSAEADLDAIAGLAADAGAGYLVLTSKHSDGFALWPTAQKHPSKGDWHARRDLVGGLADAVRASGLRMGLYYCAGYDWSYVGHPMRRGADLLLGIPTTRDYERFAAAQVRELVDRYAPDVLWGDVAWPVGEEIDALVAHYRAKVPDGLVNDRFAVIPGLDGRPRRALLRVAGRAVEALWSRLPSERRRLVFPPSPLADFTTPEYRVPDILPEGKWELARGIGHSFGANLAEGPGEILAGDALVRLFCEVVAGGGNLLVGVGPDAHGRVSEPQAAPLRELGAWLRRNAAAIRGSRPWTVSGGRTAGGGRWAATVTAGVVHLLLLDPPARGDVVVRGLSSERVVAAHHLGLDRSLAVRASGGDLVVSLPSGRPAEAVEVVRLEGEPRPR